MNPWKTLIYRTFGLLCLVVLVSLAWPVLLVAGMFRKEDEWDG